MINTSDGTAVAIHAWLEADEQLFDSGSVPRTVSGVRPGLRRGDRFWQPKYYAFEIFTRHKLEEKSADMHHNPVRAGLVKMPCERRWSSARWYQQRRSVGVPIQWVE